ncbi:putative membrane protein [Pilibacter termitis]|uniref:Putative membrane protein n=1 Tax=Pilibacter termitis TaxID=263852 RepID=A0A1T4MAV4_9ENTE|nr:phage holin family protein [Pilibacter termitis]SJZ64180.1 putative membrane protein [Pilibacter termitis]
MGFFTRLITTSLVFLGYAQFFPNMFHLSGLGVAVLAALVLSILNALVKPILTIFSLPLLLITFGLFSFVINAIILQLTSFIIGDSSFGFSNFGSSLLLAVVLTIVYSVVNDYFERRKNLENIR